MLWISGPEADPQLLNAEWRRFRGLSADQPVPEGWEFGIHEDDRPGALEAFRMAHQNREPYEREYRVRTGDGQYRWVHDHGTPWFGEGGQFLGQLGCCLDITELRTHQWTAANAERRLKTLVEKSDIIYRVRLVPSLAMEYVGGAVEELTGYTPDDFYRDISLGVKSVHPDDLDKLALTPEAARHLPGTVTYRWLHRDGRTVWAEHFRVPIFDAAGQIVGVEGLARDITARVESERKVRESEEQLRQLAARLQSAREEERAEVSRELHDELGQVLTALKLEINRAVEVFATEVHSVTSIDRLQSVVGLVDLGIATVKRISARLRPATLDHLGLAEAIRWEAMAFKARTGIRCHVRSNRKQTRLSAEQQTALFRIVQEALNNVVCHANASSVQVTITEGDSAVELRVRDNGRGITADQASAPASIGLLGMRERAALVGGTFKVSGQRGKGTVVSVHLPLAADDAEHRPRPDAEPLSDDSDSAGR
jgi:two-component system sensor histidine kinase UhpB